jgi:hypothetical protein
MEPELSLLWKELRKQSKERFPRDQSQPDAESGQREPQGERLDAYSHRSRSSFSWRSEWPDQWSGEETSTAIMSVVKTTPASKDAKRRKRRTQKSITTLGRCSRAPSPRVG